MKTRIAIVEEAKSENYTGLLLSVATDCTIKSTETGFKVTFKWNDDIHTLTLNHLQVKEGKLWESIDMGEKRQDIYIYFAKARMIDIFSFLSGFSQ